MAVVITTCACLQPRRVAKAAPSILRGVVVATVVGTTVLLTSTALTKVLQSVNNRPTQRLEIIQHFQPRRCVNFRFISVSKYVADVNVA